MEKEETYNSLDKLFKAVIEKLEDNDINYCVIGYNALAIYTSNFRTSKDIDILVYDKEFDETIELFKHNFGGFELEYIADSQIELRNPNKKYYVDFLFGVSEEALDAIFYSSSHRPILSTSANVADPEMLMILLLYALYYGSNDTKFITKKIIDIEALYTSGVLDLKIVESSIKKSYQDVDVIYKNLLKTDFELPI